MKNKFPKSLFKKKYLVLAMSPLMVLPVKAATIMVSNNLDDGTGCTLREAIDTVNQQQEGSGCFNDSTNPFGIDDTVSIQINTLTIPLENGALTISRDVVITNTSLVNRIIDAQHSSRAIHITGGANVGMERVSVRNGNAGAGDGGAILVEEASSLRLDNCFVTNSDAGIGGGISVTEGSSLNLFSCVISGNSATQTGGGIRATTSSSVSVRDSSVVGNRSSNSGGGIRLFNSALLIENSSVSSNIAGANGGGVFINGPQSGVALSNSTVSFTVVDL